jgi:nucleoside 2-deoxyribosyltransferase
MKFTLIGSTQYQEMFKSTKVRLEKLGHTVKIPAFDSHPDLDEIGICEYNREAIEWSDKVLMIWDRRSTGTIFDFGMVFALRKPFDILYLEPKTFENVMKKYSDQTRI